MLYDPHKGSIEAQKWILEIRPPCLKAVDAILELHLKVEKMRSANTKLYSYIVKKDTGFAPNPFWGYCTLATCKPAVRRTARINDWIVGLSPKRCGNRIVYAMQIEKILPYVCYYQDPQFTKKIPDYDRGPVIYKRGDNIYKPLSNGAFKQLRSMHSNGTSENPKEKIHDLGGKNVLVSIKKFYYFGSRPRELPSEFSELKVGRGHKVSFSPEFVSAFIRFIKHKKPGFNAAPTRWPSNDLSWRMAKHENHPKQKRI